MDAFPPPLCRPALVVRSRARLPTRFGEFDIVAFEEGKRLLDDVAICRGGLSGEGRVLVRVHSECVTGDVLGSQRCDCGAQLDLAMRQLGRSECGALLYLRQEGRGIGIANKVRAYALQDAGLDTVDANRHLGFDDDLRDYGVAAGMLAALGVHRVTLLTNNPDKVQGLAAAGLDVRRAPLHAEATADSRRYLDAKRHRFGHWLDP